MLSLIRSFLGSAGPAAPGPRTGPPGFAGPAGGVAAQPARPRPGGTRAAVVRRPLVDREGELSGFHFSLPRRAAVEDGGGEARAAAAARDVAELLAAMAPALLSGRVAMATLSSLALARPEVAGMVPERAMLVLSDAPFADAEAAWRLGQLRARGVRLGTLGRPCAGADFVVVDASAMSVEQLRAVGRALRRHRPPVHAVAVDVCGIEALHAALGAGFELACGDVERSAAGGSGSPLPPRFERVCRLLGSLQAGDGTAALAATLAADAELGDRLLAYANNPATDLARAVVSIDQALRRTDRSQWHRWLPMLLVAGADEALASPALREIALGRARLFERLAEDAGDPPAGLFATGLLSLLDAMLDVPMADALAPIPLACETRAALLQRGGPWRPYVDLALALERGDRARADALADRFGGPDAVAAAADEAWHWAATMHAGRKR